MLLTTYLITYSLALVNLYFLAALKPPIIEAMGLKKMHQSVEMKDTQAARGAAAQVSHLVTVEEL